MDSSGESLGCRSVLPDDVITNIMTRLPVKSLLRFKSVSKSFCALVDSPYFIRKHHNHAIKSKTNHKIIVNNRDYSYHSIDLDLLDQALKLKPPFKTDISDGTILGSVHGLLCIQVNTKDIIIWNPTTKKYKKVPEAFSSDIRNRGYIFHGFGYDLASDDYKILKINQFWNSISSYRSTKTAVYSSRSNSWQFIQDCPYRFPYHFNNEKCCTLICGELLWCVYNLHGYRYLIAAFNLATNNFSLVAHPDALNDEFNMTSDKSFKITISELSGDLCVICNYIDSQVDVWIMRNFRVKESWTKLFSIAKQGLISCRFYSPIAYSKRGDEIMLVNEYKQLFWYNLKENIPRNIKVRDWPGGTVQMIICVESLYPPIGSWREE